MTLYESLNYMPGSELDTLCIISFNPHPNSERDTYSITPILQMRKLWQRETK